MWDLANASREAADEMERSAARMKENLETLTKDSIYNLDLTLKKADALIKTMDAVQTTWQGPALRWTLTEMDRLFSETVTKLELNSERAKKVIEGLSNLMTKEFPESASIFIGNYDAIIKAVLNGTVSVTDALGELEKLEKLLNAYGLAPDEMADVSKFSQKLKDLLRNLQNAGSGSGGGGDDDDPDLTAPINSSGAGGRGGGGRGRGGFVDTPSAGERALKTLEEINRRLAWKR